MFRSAVGWEDEAPNGRLDRCVDGVRVSFENSTVCRAFLFGLVVLCQFDDCALVAATPSWWPGCQLGPVFVGEFDPGSGRTLAACLTHASRAVRPFGVHERRTGE